MFLIRESCYGRQRISLKIVINSRVRFIARLSPHTCQSVYYKQSGNFASLLRVSPNCNIYHGRWITLSSLARTYVYDLHLIVPKFKAIR